MHEPGEHEDSPSVATNRTMEIVVALVLIGVASVFVMDATRLGHGWGPDGPLPGYFPFYMALFLGVASSINLLRAALRRDTNGEGSFVSSAALGRVLWVLLPTLAYIFLIGWTGIYLASAVFIIGFMIVLGGEGPIRSVLVGVGVALALFVVFERWFLVPLPKGPLEAWLGF